MELNACGVNSPLSVIGSVLNDAPSGVLVVARNSRLLFVSKLLLFVNVSKLLAFGFKSEYCSCSTMFG